MNAQERLLQSIDEQRGRLRASVPSNRQSAIRALLRVQDRLPHSTSSELQPDLITGRRLANLGGNLAFALCMDAESTNDDAPTTHGFDGWAEQFLEECDWLAEAGLVLTHCETGFMRLADDGNETFDTWITTKRAPTSWRERADIDWWAALLARQWQHVPENIDAERRDAGNDAAYRRVANAHVKSMTYQFGYPSNAVIDGCTVKTYLDILERLIAWVLQAHDHGEAAVPHWRSERSLVAALASLLRVEAAIVGRAVAAFTLDRENAAYHAAVPGVAAAPLVRIGPDQLVPSRYGLTTEPLLFLTRELRRRSAQEYNNTAFLRENVFRQELYALFGDKRFVTSTGRIELRRDSGNVRTDIDAVVFDRKTGTLGVFELKSHDPFARSIAELARQRDNVLYANRQVSGVLAWLQQHGANEILHRVDARTAKTFRAQKVYPFVLGRYVAHFNDGAEPDRRAAWGTWPQVLRLLDGQPVRTTDSNPIASLFNRLAKDTPLAHVPNDDPARRIALGTARIIVYPSYAAYQANAAVEHGSRSR